MYRFYSQEGEEAAKVLVGVSSSLWEHSICHQRIVSQRLTIWILESDDAPGLYDCAASATHAAGC